MTTGDDDDEDEDDDDEDADDDESSLGMSHRPSLLMCVSSWGW